MARRISLFGVYTPDVRLPSCGPDPSDAGVTHVSSLPVDSGVGPRQRRRRSLVWTALPLWTDPGVLDRRVGVGGMDVGLRRALTVPHRHEHHLDLHRLVVEYVCAPHRTSVPHVEPDVSLLRRVVPRPPLLRQDSVVGTGPRPRPRRRDLTHEVLCAGSLGPGGPEREVSSFFILGWSTGRVVVPSVVVHSFSGKLPLRGRRTVCPVLPRPSHTTSR